MDNFTHELTGAAFIESNGKFRIKKNESGRMFFVSTGVHPLYRTGYISDGAATIILDEMAAGRKMKDIVSSFLDFAVISYTDDDEVDHTCPTLMPKASGEDVFNDDDDWE